MPNKKSGSKCTIEDGEEDKGDNSGDMADESSVVGRITLAARRLLLPLMMLPLPDEDCDDKVNAADRC